MEKYMCNRNSYFAAANGYAGFRSYFPEVFSPLNLSKLYVLKGGPGTGKSTLMKRIADKFEKTFKVTRILCSSDIASLDGVLIEGNGIKVGIADGTEPHAIEPVFPGAVEEIVNLGDGFDYQSLRRASNEIIELTKNKKAAYKRAYAALQAAGEIYSSISYILSDFDIYKAAECLCLDKVKSKTTSEVTAFRDPFLLSAFSKHGSTRMPVPVLDKECFFICGDGVSENIVMEKIASECIKRNAVERIYESPLSSAVPDVIVSDNIVYAISRGGGTHFEGTYLFDKIGGYTDLRSAHNEFLKEAQDYFAQASELHFKLEDIYSRSISFSNNDVAEAAMSREITEILINNAL